MAFNIAIDGPAGAGKSTIAKEVASRLQFIYVDTGAMYRALALHVIRQGLQAEEEEGISKACEAVSVTIEYENGAQQVLLNGENVSGLIRTEEVGNMASAISVYPKVREKLKQLQQDLAASANVLMDGRDIGTCILPNADVKIYLTASSKVRAKRRYAELQNKGIACDLEEIEKDIIERDNRDMTRAIAPLRQAEDAVLIDSSHMTIEEVIEAMIDAAKSKGWKVEG